jgi:hypothetical protein
MTAQLRNALIGIVVAAALAVAVLVVLTNDDSGVTEATRGASPSGTAPAEAPPFRFEIRDRQVVATAHRHISTRERRDAQEAAETVRSLVSDLYARAFLDPARWSSRSYDDVFGIFAGGARDEARHRVNALTAGPGAAERFAGIEPIEGVVKLRILLDRGGHPILVSSAAHFRARASGPEPTVIRSDGIYLFERVDRAWRIVSFDVQRSDRPVEAA